MNSDFSEIAASLGARLRLYASLGIQEIPYGKQVAVKETAPISAASEAAPTPAVAANCEGCALKSPKTRPVVPSGQGRARVLVVFGSPDKESSIKGEAVSAGVKQKTQEIITAMKLKGSDVRFVNAVRCFTGEDAHAEASLKCRPYLDEVLKECSPEALLVFGDEASKALLGKNVDELRKKELVYEGVRAFVTHSPKDLLSGEKNLRGEVWEDVQSLMRLIGIIK